MNDPARFEVAGGNYRLIAAFDFRRQIVFVKFIGTQAESRGLVLRDALPDASGQQFASACRGLRLCNPALGAESRCCRFLGIVRQRQLPDLGVGDFTSMAGAADTMPPGPKTPEAPPSNCAFQAVI
jgi:HigB_toxin, RelE-like toxic component of a toxin-antitoxin system